MNWYLFVTVYFIVSLHQVFAKIPTDSTGASASEKPQLFRLCCKLNLPNHSILQNMKIKKISS